MVSERGDNRNPIFYGKNGKDFQLWALKKRTALRGKEIIDAIEGDQVKETVNEKALSITVPALEDNPLRVV